MFHNARQALVVLAAIAAVLAFLVLTEDEARLGPHVVLVSGDAGEIPAVRDYVDHLRDEGFSVTSDLEAVLRRLEAKNSNVTIFAVTRQSVGDVPGGVWADLYQRGVVLIGLDVAIRELQPLAYGYPAGVGVGTMLPYTPDRPIFSMLRSNCSGSGRTSDWLGNLDIAAIARSRSLESCPTAASGSP